MYQEQAARLQQAPLAILRMASTVPAVPSVLCDDTVCFAVATTAERAATAASRSLMVTASLRKKCHSQSPQHHSVDVAVINKSIIWSAVAMTRCRC